VRMRLLLVAAALFVSAAIAQQEDAEAPAAREQAVPTATEQIAELEAALARVEATYPDKSALVYQVNVPLARLKLKKALLRSERTYYGLNQVSITEEVQAGLELIAALERGELHEPPRSTLTELAYITQNDGTVQPYYLHIPESYDPSVKWPLIVFMHGYVPSITVLDPWVLSEDVCQIAEDNGCILLIPYGRRNTDFQGVGEVDVFRAMAETRRLLSIDPARIHLSGVSMGGQGAWAMGLRHPGVFAAVTPISGQTDMARWWGWDLEKLPPFKRFLIEWDNAVDLAPSLRGQSFFCQHGENDTLIPVIESRSMVELGKQLGTPIEYYEFSGASHYIYWDLPCFRNAWEWTKDFRLNPSPERVTFKTYSLSYDASFWLTVRQFKRWGIPATVDARVTDGGKRLEVSTSNVAVFDIDLRTCPLAQAEAFRVTVRHGEIVVPPGNDGRLHVELSRPPAAEGGWPPPKRKGLCGPAEDVFNSAFIAVQGTAGTDEENDELARQVGTWAEEWDDFADGQPRVCTDQELADEDMRRFNLVLFGTPETNSVIARLADRLPITIGEHSYTLLGKTYEGEDLGLVLCYPNPLAPDRYVLIYAGELYGRKCSSNHKHDLLPDFLIFDSTRFTTGDTEMCVCGGWFDVDWLPKPDLTWEGDEEPAPAAGTW